MKCEYCGRSCLPGEIICSGCSAPIENPIPIAETKQTQGSKIEVSVGGVNIKIDGPTSTTTGGANPSLAPLGNETQRQRKQREQREQEVLRKSPAMEIPDHFKCVRSIYAGFFSRMIAFWIDFIVIVILWGIIGEPIESIFSRDILGLAMSSYFIGLEVFAKGATLGKRAMKIRVVNAKGENITLLQGIIRFFTKFLSLIFFCIGFIIIVFSKRKQGLHDSIADTYVIKEG